jgi:sulfoxide reductase heme-binding subunit YedZ
MSLRNHAKPEAASRRWLAVLVTVVAPLVLLAASPYGALLRSLLVQYYALDTQAAMWYLTRAAGFTAYLLLWFSSVWGLLIPTKLLDKTLSGTFTFDIHQVVSLLSLGFLGLHMLVLLADRYLPFSVAQILVPFISPYRPLWVGTGVIAMYLTVLVTVTFYLRKRIGMNAFRTIHLFSLLGYLAALGHAYFSGTDSTLWMAKLMYAGTFLVFVFLVTYWLVLGAVNALVKKRV